MADYDYNEADGDRLRAKKRAMHNKTKRQLTIEMKEAFVNGPDAIEAFRKKYHFTERGLLMHGNCAGIDLRHYDEGMRQMHRDRRAKAEAELNDRIGKMKKASCVDCQNKIGSVCALKMRPGPHGSCEEYSRHWRLREGHNNNGGAD